MNRKPFILVPPPAFADAETGRRYYLWLAGHGIDGLFLNGSTGEFTVLPQPEKIRTVRTAAQCVGGRMLLIAGAIEPSVPQTLRAIENYRRAGAHAAAVCPPFYFRHAQANIVTFIHAIADASGLPLYLYDIPAFTSGMSFETIQTLARHPNIVGLKDSSRDFVRLERLLGEVKPERPEFRIFTGTEELLLVSLLMGADGATIATAGIEPEKVMALVRDYCEGDLLQARQKQLELMPRIRDYFAKDFPEGFKEAVEAEGFPVRWE